MLTTGNFKDNVFSNSPRHCMCYNCTFYEKQNLKCKNPVSMNYNECMSPDATCDNSKLLCDEIWLIVRSLKELDYDKKTSILYIPELSPSPKLFSKFLQWKKEGKWNKDTFENMYVPEFINELKTEEKQVALIKLKDECMHKNVLLACYCEDNSMCHRSIILGVLQGMGVKTYNVGDYSHYYELYKGGGDVSSEQMNSSFYLAVTGNADYYNYTEFRIIMDKSLQKHNELGHKIIIVTGNSKGTETLAQKYADINGYEKIIVSVDFKKYGKSAGYTRNEQMHKMIARNSKRGCVCFWDGETSWVQHNFETARRYGTPVRVYNYKERRLIT